MVQSQSSVEFDFNSGRPSPCGSSPSTPKGFCNVYFSAPTTPERATNFYSSTTPSSPYHLDHELSIAGVKTRLLLPPQSPKLTRNSQHKKSFWNAFSPKRKKDDNFDTYETAAVESNDRKTKPGRKKERVFSLSKRRITRSLSPSRVSKYPWEGKHEQENTKDISTISKLTSSSSIGMSRKWRLKDLLLFRSASEGRASDKDPLKKYSYQQHRKHESAKSSGSIQSTDGSRSVIPRSQRGPISAHELHYTVNKAISQDLKKRSFLPYKQGILGRLAINPTVHALAHGFGSLAHTYA